MSALRPLCLLLLFLMLTSCPPPQASTLSFKQLLAKGEADVAAGNYAAAAQAFRAACDHKAGKSSACYRAAELYTRIRDYGAAAAAYQLTPPDEDRWPLLGLQYGRALKQDGRYDEADRVLSSFLAAYNGVDRRLIAEVVRNEKAGIALARSWQTRQSAVGINRPGRGVNTNSDEFGPVALAGDQLFFTSTAGGQSRLYQSRLQAQRWEKAIVPPGFPVIAQGDFGTGSFSSDGRVFYFTVCSGLAGEEATNRCEIFRGERSAAGRWSQPQRLSETINLPGYNNAFPAVVRDAQGRETLYFASDRPGGRGGMDLYVARADTPAEPTRFGTAQPLAAGINTIGNEISPLLDPDSGLLYFASDGHPGLGGQDIFRVQLDAATARPENPGPPVNSTADDFGFFRLPGGSTGYLVSNRSFGTDKRSTTDMDIYQLDFQAGQARLKATVYDNTTGDELGGAEVTLQQVNPGGGETTIDKRRFPTGVYTFDLAAASQYRVIVELPGYQRVSYQVTTRETGAGLYGQPVFLQRGRLEPPVTIVPENSTTSSAPTAPTSAPESTESPARMTARSAAPLAFRIQISAQRKFNPQARKYDRIRALGDLIATPIPGRNLQRITVGFYTDEAAARKALAEVRQNGFATAFAVKFDHGTRSGQMTW